MVDCLELTHCVGKSAALLAATHILVEVRTFVRAKRMQVSSALLNKYALVSVAGSLAVQQTRACNKDNDKLRSKPSTAIQNRSCLLTTRLVLWPMTIMKLVWNMSHLIKFFALRFAL